MVDHDQLRHWIDTQALDEMLAAMNRLPARAGAELPQRLPGVGIQGHELPGVLASEEHPPARGEHCGGDHLAVERLAPLRLSRQGIDRDRRIRRS